MDQPKFRFLLGIAVLAMLVIACNLTDNFAGSENAFPSVAEGVDPSSPVGGDPVVEQAGQGDVDAQPGAAVSSAIDLAARQEVIAMLSQSNPPPDLSQLPAEVVNCLANDFFQWDQETSTIVTIVDEYQSERQQQISCSLTLNPINTSNENIVVVYENMDYSERVQRPLNRRYVTVQDAILPGDQVYLVRSLDYHPLDPAEGLYISTSLAFAAFYDRPECQAYIEDEALLQQIWQPLDYPCKDYLPKTSP